MQSKTKFESNILGESVNFLDVKFIVSEGKIKTSVYSKPTDDHLYLNSKSCHPNHIIKTIPKKQLIRVQRIFSETSDYGIYANIMKKHSRGYNKKDQFRTISFVRKMKMKICFAKKIK